ncbi:unnamed protein product [Meganyctiphanes norvegica]|uniref:peptide-methionine (R)-S-oxide reductase n=1 Tax=Meganyctiphanes norvegica TaxID=48144 RepID=A0AAV2S868_MEGNR
MASIYTYHHRQLCPKSRGKILHKHFEGLYVCIECGFELFSSQSKYEHQTPWPAFTKTIHSNSIKKVPEEGRDGAFKVSCGKCGNGLGHEFLKDGPDGNMSRF